MDQKLATITLQLQDLEFLNSPGINVISQFVLKLRKQKSSRLLVRGAREIPWHARTLENLKRLMPEAEVCIE